MATLVYNGQACTLSRKVREYLAKRGSGFGVEDIANRFCTGQNTIRKELYRLKVVGVVEHDGRRPRTWKLRDEEPKAA